VNKPSNGSIGHPLGFVIGRLNTLALLYRLVSCLSLRVRGGWADLGNLTFSKKPESNSSPMDAK